jgi:ketosteroid isomerase-like protein
MRRAPRFVTPEEAEAAFYEAFEHADVEAMMGVWAADEAIVCVHPNGPRLEGRAPIRESWAEIFAPGTRLKFTLAERACTRDAATSVHLLKEIIEVDGVLQGVMLATNVYRLIGGDWLMVLHHASPEPGTPRRDEVLH